MSGPGKEAMRVLIVDDNAPDRIPIVVWALAKNG